MQLKPVTPTAKAPAANFTGDGDGTTWLEPVTDEEYQLANKR